MPEGDTIHRAANLLRPALEGNELVRFEAQRLVGSRPRRGETILAVRAVGKHLLIDFSGGLTLETHMRMTGSWHLYATDARWRKPAHLLRCLVEVDGWIAACFSAPVVRTFRTGAASTPIDHLGPDLTVPGADLDGCLRRMAVLGLDHLTIAEVLLDQRVACGVGNVYKSEVCWAERLDPFTALGDVPEALRRRLVATANRLLPANLGPGRRTTVAGGLAVYGHRGRPCRRCGAPIRSRSHGEQNRVTYWCPGCQSRPAVEDDAPT